MEQLSKGPAKLLQSIIFPQLVPLCRLCIDEAVLKRVEQPRRGPAEASPFHQKFLNCRLQMSQVLASVRHESKAIYVFLFFYFNQRANLSRFLRNLEIIVSALVPF